ncbi:MAG TPA: class I SAM-dependent methyltransferase [Gemmatimonadaceae bacterium]|nr:class I SAM-dependent methyltransferase [Gemmatimonadaceae bacterium]
MTEQRDEDDPVTPAHLGGDLNRASYDRIAARWDEARLTLRARERALLEMLLAELPVPSDVLDVGCGTGRPIAELVLARGHRVTGIDQSEGQLRFARERFPGATWIRARIEDRAFGRGYDAVICWDALFHVAREHHHRVLRAIHDCLVPGGRLVLTVGGSAHPPFTDTMFDERFFYDSFPPDEVLAMTDRIGFELVTGEFLDLPGPGRDKGRYVIVARRRANAP